MGDSDDDYQSHNNSGNLGHNGSSSSGVPSSMNNHNNNYNSNNKKNTGRDKFNRERDDSSNGNSSYNNNRRDWNNSDRNNRGNDSYKNNRMSSNQQYGGGYGHSNSSSMGSGYQGRQGGYSDYPKKYSHGDHDSSPPPYKRNRRDDDSIGGGRSHGGDYSSPQSNYNSINQRGHQSHESDFPTQPPFLSFKLFLQQQDDNISDEDAIRKYNDYKMDFKKTQINNFFLEHKEEEWFKLRYHPDENFKRRNEQNQFILNRLEVFTDLMKKGWLDNTSIEFDKSKDIIKFLDAVVIKLEGGSDEDLKILDDIPNGSTPEADNDDVKELTEEKSDVNKENDNDEKLPESNGDHSKNGKKRKSENDSGSESGAYTDSDGDEDGAKNGEGRKKKSNRKGSESKKTDSEKNKNLHKTTSIFMRNLAPSVTKQDLENLCKDYEGFKRVAISDPASERGFFRRGWITFESHVDVKKICWNLQNTKVKDFNPGAIVNRELTNRIRSNTNLAAHHKSVVKNNIKLAMEVIQNLDKRWKLWQDKNDESIVEGEEEETEATVDDKMDSESTETAKLEKLAFCQIKSNEPKYLSHKYQGPNPLFENITDYLVDEVDAEEQELLGADASNAPSKSGSSLIEIEIDPSFNKVLDKLVLYLRVVHSFDFYNSIEYQQEDSMPNRCGIMFTRPSMPINISTSKITQDEVTQYIKQFETKMKPYVEYKEKLDQQTAKKLGLKERKEEVEKFIKTNTQELAADRWLCPLSGKKFKGPEFIRKHLFYKHMDKIVEVKKEVEYYNNYVFDPKRPQLPEHTTNKPTSSQQSNGQFGSPNAPSNYSSHNSNYMHTSPGGNMLQSNMLGQMGGYGMQNRQMSGYGMHQGYDSSMQSPGYGTGYGGYNNGGYQMNRGGRGGYNMSRGGRGSGRDSREMIQYKDLDAPEDN